jgi:hypothetical protein
MAAHSISIRKIGFIPQDRIDLSATAVLVQANDGIK